MGGGSVKFDLPLTNETLPAYFGLVGRPNARGSVCLPPALLVAGELYLYFTHKSTGLPKNM